MRVLLAVLVLVLVCVAPANAAAVRMHSMGRVHGLVTDGRRFVAYEPDGATTRVRNTLTGSQFDVTTPEGCKVALVGGGQLVWECPAADGLAASALMMLDLKTKRLHAPVGFGGLRALADQTNVNGRGMVLSWSGVGSHWLLGLAYWDFGQAVSELAYNWRTGKVLRNLPASPSAVADPNRPGLARRMCKPLRRVRQPEARAFVDSRDPFLPFQYDGLAALGELRVRERWQGGHMIFDKLFFQRCASRRRLMLGRSPLYVQLGGGYATWMSLRNEMNLLDARTGKRIRLAGPTGATLLQHTANRVYAIRPAVGPSPFAAYTARLP